MLELWKTWKDEILEQLVGPKTQKKDVIGSWPPDSEEVFENQAGPRSRFLDVNGVPFEQAVASRLIKMATSLQNGAEFPTVDQLFRAFSIQEARQALNTEENNFVIEENTVIEEGEQAITYSLNCDQQYMDATSNNLDTEYELEEVQISARYRNPISTANGNGFEDCTIMLTGLNPDDGISEFRFNMQTNFNSCSIFYSANKFYLPDGTLLQSMSPAEIMPFSS